MHAFRHRLKVQVSNRLDGTLKFVCQVLVRLEVCAARKGVVKERGTRVCPRSGRVGHMCAQLQALAVSHMLEKSVLRLG